MDQHLCHVISTLSLIQEGIAFGLLLSIMVGPIMITIIQACLEGGKTAGLEVAGGIWISDFIIISLVYLGLVNLSEKVGGFSIETILRYAGGLVFLAVGAGIASRQYVEIEEALGKKNLYDHGKYFVKGFLVNTINPFTFIFWISVIGTRVVARNLDHSQALVLLGSILGTIVFTDTAKVFLSGWIRHRLKFQTLVIVQRIAGLALVLAGLYLLFFFDVSQMHG